MTSLQHEVKKHDESERWFVMTHYDMKRFKEWIVAENVRRLSQGKVVAEPFFPSDFLRGENVEGSLELASVDARAIASDFAHFVFLKASEATIEEIVTADAQHSNYIHLRYYTDTDGRKAVVPSRFMQDFFDACLQHRGFFEIIPSLAGIEAMDKVEIKTGPFAGQQASVVRVQHVKGEIQLDLALELVNGVMNIRMCNVDSRHVSILNRSTVDAIRKDFIEYTQIHLLTILEHRVKGVKDEAVMQRDMAMLTRLFRYRDHHVENQAAQLHFLSLMLICAHLCRYAEEERKLTELALDSLAEINKKSESKAATDTRAYLWIALYLATRNPQYRDSAKQYVRDFQPKSDRLRRFVRLIRTGKKI